MARRLPAIRLEGAMKKLETILVGTDFTPLADVALAAALDLVRATGAKRLHVVHVINTATAATIFPYSVPEAQLMQALERSVQEAQARLDGLDFVDAGYTITRKAILGPPGRELALEAERVGADLVVAASHGYGAVRGTPSLARPSWARPGVSWRSRRSGWGPTSWWRRPTATGRCGVPSSAA